MSDETQVKVGGRGWRYAVIWLVLVLGMGVGLCLSEREYLVLSFYSPVLLTMGGISLIGLSSLCLWGLPLVVPLLCLFHSWLNGRGGWWRVLPAALLLMALLTALGVPIAGVDLPMIPEGSLFQPPPVPSSEDITAACGITMTAWGLCGRAMSIIGLMLVLHVVVVCGLCRSWQGVVSYYHAFLRCSRELRSASVVQEGEASAAGKNGDGSESAT